MQKRTKIVATIGPACETSEMIEKMIRSGMNVARLNFSHGSYKHHAMLIKNIRLAAAKTGEPVAIMQDLQGPKIRVGSMPEGGIVLQEGSPVVFDTGIKTYADNRIPVDWDLLHQFVKPGERILLNDGRMECMVDQVNGTEMHATVKAGGTLISHKGINVPDSTLTVRAMTDKDKQDAQFGVEQGVDYIALSFVRTPEDVLELRELIAPHPIQIITKMERREAIERADDILEVADGIMVARGDLGVEIAAEKVPAIQKTLIQKALAVAKPVIVATQMLDSMQENSRPTRAEVSDVANAVIDHADAVMLSNETAVGKFPVETVTTMANIIRETESSRFDDMSVRETKNTKDPDDVLSHLSQMLAEEIGAKAIVASSAHGDIARLISRYRPELPIIVASTDTLVAHQMNLSWGVVPFIIPAFMSPEDLLHAAKEVLVKRELAQSGDTVIVLTGEPLGENEHERRVELRTL